MRVERPTADIRCRLTHVHSHQLMTISEPNIGDLQQIGRDLRLLPGDMISFFSFPY
jgi:hypothetical protein